MRVSPTANQQSVLLLSSCAVAPTARFGRMCNDTSERQCGRWQCGSDMASLVRVGRSSGSKAGPCR